MRTDTRSRRHLLWASVVSVAVVVGALQAVPSFGHREGSLLQQYDASKAAALEALPHVDPPGTPPHNHNDPATKNAVSRAGEVGADTQDPTTAAEARANAAYVASERRLPEPTLTKIAMGIKRGFHPRTRYEMAGGCYTLRTPRGVYLARSGGALVLGTKKREKSARFFFKATDLGSYLLYGVKRDFLSGAGLAADPSPDADWVVRRTSGGYFGLRQMSGRALRADGRRLVLGDVPSGFVLERVRGCAAYPESGIDIAGNPHGGVTSFQEVRGYVDAHTHGMAFEFLGGEAHCGKPWDRYGAPYALVDCEDHTATGGSGGVLESFLSEDPNHDPVGWPTFKDWPAPESLTHEGTYYRWMERAWRGGQRLFVNLLVENNKLCEIYPLKRNSCDDMDSIRLQARQMHNLSLIHI